MRIKFNSSIIENSYQNQKYITNIGKTIGIIWTIISVLYMLFSKSMLKFALGSPDSIILVQLLTYSFINGPVILLVSNLFGLYVVIQYAKICLHPLGFIRLYSLGNIGGGIIYILINLTKEETVPLIGAAIGLMACLGAMVVMATTQRQYLFGRFRPRLIWVVIFYAAFPVIKFIVQLFGVKDESLALNSGMSAGFFFGIVYAFIERVWKRYN